MKNYLRKKICYFFGHKYNEIALDYGYYECERCKIYGYYYDIEELKGEEFYNWRRQIWCKYTWKIRDKLRKYK